MVRSYSLPVATQLEHDDQHRSLSMLRTSHCWWSGGWVASGNGTLDIPDSSDMDADYATHRLLPQSNTRKYTHARAASAVPTMQTTPENTSKRQSWSPRYTRRNAKLLLRDDTVLADSSNTPDYWATSARALEQHEPRVPSHMAAAMSGTLMPCVVPQSECTIPPHIRVARAATLSPLVES